MRLLNSLWFVAALAFSPPAFSAVPDAFSGGPFPTGVAENGWVDFSAYIYTTPPIAHIRKTITECFAGRWPINSDDWNCNAIKDVPKERLVGPFSVVGGRPHIGGGTEFRILFHTTPQLFDVWAYPKADSMVPIEIRGFTKVELSETQVAEYLRYYAPLLARKDTTL